MTTETEPVVVTVYLLLTMTPERMAEIVPLLKADEVMIVAGMSSMRPDFGLTERVKASCRAANSPQRERLPDNSAAMARYNARYSNETYQAIRAVCTELGLPDTALRDIMNLTIDSALWLCGHSDYAGPDDVMISAAREELYCVIGAFCPWRGRLDIRKAVNAHLALFEVN